MLEKERAEDILQRGIHMKGENLDDYIAWYEALTLEADIEKTTPSAYENSLTAFHTTSTKTACAWTTRERTNNGRRLQFVDRANTFILRTEKNR